MWPILAVLFAGGLVLLLLALGLIAVVVAAASAMPLLLILAGIWLLVRAMRGSNRGRGQPAAPWSRPRPATGAARPRTAEQPAQRSRPMDRPRRELPIDVRVTIEQIRHKADVLLGYADRFPPFSQDLHIVRQTASEYLPRTVRAYLALPGDDDPVVGATGRTALQELREQLRLMDAKLDEITQALQRHDLDRMAANRRFLEDRFDLPDRDAREAPSRQGMDAA